MGYSKAYQAECRYLWAAAGSEPSERIESLVREMHSLFGSRRRLLFVPYALADHDGYGGWFCAKGLHGGF
jgi:hypothetical protein